MSRHLRTAGFTLVEALVALVLASLVVAAAIGVPRFVNRLDSQAAQRAEGRDALLGLDRLLRAMVQGAVPDIAGRGNGPPGSADRLTIVSLGPPILALDRPGPMTLRAELRDDGVALLFDWIDPSTETAGEAVVLEGARSVSFAYFGAPAAAEGGAAAAPAWLPVWNSPQALPLAVYLRVELPAFDEPVELVARAASRLPEACLLLPAEPGCSGDGG